MGYQLTSNKRSVENNTSIIRLTTEPQALSIPRHWIHAMYPASAWKKQSCVIIGGGPSVSKIEDFSFVKKHRSIAVNKSFLLCHTDLIYAMDARFYAWLTTGALDRHDGIPIHAAWKQSRAVKVFLEPLGRKLTDFGKDVMFVKRRESGRISTSIAEGIHGSNNSFLGALFLAIAMGADPIYLVGCDQKAANKTHWHCGYPDQPAEDLRKRLNAYVDSFSSFAPNIRQHAKVYLVGYDSALTCFPCIPLKEIS